MHTLTRTVDPTIYPISEEQFLRHARGEGRLEIESETITACIKGAIDQIELETRRQYIKATFTMQLRCWWNRILEIPRPPLLGVTSVKYQDENDVEQTLASSLYTQELKLPDSPFGGIIIKPTTTLPTLVDDPNRQRVVVTFDAGYYDAVTFDDAAARAALPGQAVLCCRALSTHYFGAARHIGITEGTFSEVPHGYMRMVQGLKVPVLWSESA